MRIIYRNCDLILSQSSSLRNYLISNYGIANVELVHNPSFDFKTKHPSSINKPVKILYAGNLGNFQCIEDLLFEISSCDSKFPNVQFLIAGDGPKKMEVLKGAKDFSNLVYLGYLNQRDLAKEIESVDFLILGLKESEVSKLIIPSKFQAYLSSSRPVLVSAGEELTKIIDKYNLGFNFNFANKGELTELIQNKILNITPDVYSQKAFNCRTFFEENYTIKSTTEKIKLLLNKI